MPAVFKDTLCMSDVVRHVGCRNFPPRSSIGTFLENPNQKDQIHS